MEISTSFSELIILHTGGQTWYNFFYTTCISVDLPHHEIFRAKVGKGGIMYDTHESLSGLRGAILAHLGLLSLVMPPNHL